MGLFSTKITVPPPDPELTRIQIQSIKAQQEISEQQLAMQKEMQPLQMEQLRFGLDSQRTAFEQAQADRTYALNKRSQYDAALKPFLDKATNFDEAARRAELQTDTDEAITAAFGGAQAQQARTLGRSGFGDSALKSQAAVQQAKMAEATTRAGTGHAISAQAKQEGMQAKTDAVNMLAGYPAAASQLTTQGADIAGASIAGTNAGISGMYQTGGAASKIWGEIGSSAGQMWSSQASARQQAETAAKQQKSQMWGTVASVAMMAVMMSDRRLKENIRRIGTAPNGLPIYMYNFKGNNEVEVGVMADEVEQVVPDAVYRVGPYKAVDYSRI